MIYEITRKLGATRGWKDGGEAFVVAANVLGECLKTGQLLLRSLLSIFVLGTALRDSYCVPLWAKAIVPSSDRFPLFRPVFMQSAVQVRSIHRIIDRGSRSSSIIFLLFRWKEISLFSFFLRERFIIIKIYLLVLVCLPFEYNTIIFGEDWKIGVGLLFRTKPVPNKNLDGSRRATGSSAGCRRLTSLITSDRIVENGFPPRQPSPCYHLSSRHRRSTRLSALDRGRIKATVEFDRRSAADPRMIPRLLSWYPPAWYLIRGEV